jgi:hypothetical protein
MPSRKTGGIFSSLKPCISGPPIAARQCWRFFERSCYNAADMRLITGLVHGSLPSVHDYFPS